MENENMQALIDHYKREILDFNRKSKKAQAEEKKPEEPMKPIQNVPAQGSNPPGESRSQPSAQPKDDGVNLEESESPDTSKVEKPDENSEPSNEEPSLPVSLNMPSETVKTFSCDGDDCIQKKVIDLSANEDPVYLDIPYKSYEEYTKVNSRKGYLKVQVFAADHAFPIPDCRVLVYRKIGEKDHIFYDKLTDISGIVDNLVLPAPDKSDSLKPDGKLPFAAYNIHTEHPKFGKVLFENAPIFDGIESIQQVQMFPQIAVPKTSKPDE